MVSQRVDGVIISSSQISRKQLRQLDRFEVSFVLINNQALDKPDIHSVYHDDAYGSKQLLDHLLALGHQRIAYLGNARGGRTNAKRLQGYREALTQAGISIDPDYLTNGQNGLPESGWQGMQSFLALSELPTAVVCYNDMMAVGAIQAIHQAGLRVPEDISGPLWR